MGYSGTVPSEHSSGSHVHRGAITKTGQRQPGQPEAITALAWKAQQRLCSRYRRLLARGKPTPHVITAAARELVGFIWAIGVTVEREHTMAA